VPSKKKPSAKFVWEQSIKELLAKYDINPLEEAIKMAAEEIPLKEGDEQFIEALMDDYEVVVKDGGERVLRPKFKHRKDIWLELAQYIAPKLRSTETKGQVDYNFNITIKRFEDAPEHNRVINVTPKQLVE